MSIADIPAHSWALLALSMFRHRWDGRPGTKRGKRITYRYRIDYVTRVQIARDYAKTARAKGWRGTFSKAKELIRADLASKRHRKEVGK